MTQLEQLKSILDQGGESYNETEHEGKTYLQIIMSENIICFSNHFVVIFLVIKLRECSQSRSL